MSEEEMSRRYGNQDLSDTEYVTIRGMMSPVVVKSKTQRCGRRALIGGSTLLRMLYGVPDLYSSAIVHDYLGTTLERKTRYPKYTWPNIVLLPSVHRAGYRASSSSPGAAMPKLIL